MVPDGFETGLIESSYYLSLVSIFGTVISATYIFVTSGIRLSAVIRGK